MTVATLALVSPTMTCMADPIPLPELRGRIEAAESAGEREVVLGAADLSRVSQASIQANADRAAWEATRSRPVEEVAAEWGVSKWTLMRRASRHNARLKEQET